MKFTSLIISLIISVSCFAQKVYSVNYSNMADIKVYVVKYESQADLKVFKVKYENQVGKNTGKWFFYQIPQSSRKKSIFC